MKVLIADDCAVTRNFLVKALTDWGYQTLTANDGNKALAALSDEYGPSLAILDWMMPEIDGVQVCQSVRRQVSNRYVYMIFLTARDTREDLLEAFDAEADDFLTKPIDADELRQRLRAGTRILELEQRLIDTQDLLRYQANHDPVTCLINRRAVLDRLEAEDPGVERHGAVEVADGDLAPDKGIGRSVGH